MRANGALAREWKGNTIVGLSTAKRGSARRLSWVLLALVACLVLPSAASATTISVTTTTDELDEGSRCSIREAITSANTDSNTGAEGCVAGDGADRIVVPAGRFPLGRSGDPFPTTSEDLNVYGDLDVLSDVTIAHGGIRPAVVDSLVSQERVFQIGPGATVTITGLTITGGNASTGTERTGGGVLNEGTLTVNRSLIVGNQATFGGGLSTEGSSTATLVNSTLSSNDAEEDGGGLSSETGGTVNLRSTTVSNNTADDDRNGGGDGGGIFASTSGGGGNITLINSLIAGNHDTGQEAHDCARLGGGSISSQGRNMIGNTNGCNYVQGPNDLLNRGAQILPLANNGGPTETHSLRKTSPAINAASACPALDQRGVKRSLGGKCDIGAWELARCRGIVINIIGTNGPELLVGTDGRDGILGLGSSDTLRGVGGNDGLCGGTGADFLAGGLGIDALDGGGGRDTCNAGGRRNKRSVSCELPRRR